MTVTTDGESDTEADEDTTADEGAVDEASEAPERRWRKKLLAGAAAAVVVASLAGCGYLGWTVWQDRATTRAGEQAREAAVAYAQVLTSIDANKVDENFDQVLGGATGEFKDMYSQSSMQLRQLLIDNKATAHGVVLESAVQSQSKDRVVVLLFVDQSVTNTSMPDPRIDRSRIKMTMEHVDGAWRTSKVELP
ncbi:hypothetical protein H7I41_28700 [Mycobacterium manitobense]|uniref:Mce protein n=1 Tax=[Mycobacterium] manitobense TaxID=190147 RepID=A0A9X2YVF1_9MYCO|nr:hypothetical protein [[Mycobacterium] manitobense]MCV7173906.1 hypothetical protein [[Mycobacterium] manitobense]